MKGLWIVLGAALLAAPAAAAPADAGRTETEVVDILHPPPAPPPPIRTTPTDPAALHLKALAVACVQSRAAEVERAEATLSAAVDFLVADLCHDPVEAYSRFVRNSQMVEQMRTASATGIDIWSVLPSQMTDEQRQRYQAAMQQVQRQQAAQRDAWQHATVDPETGDIRGAPSGSYAADDDEDSPADVTFAGAFRPAAAEAVLAARTSRLAGPR